MELQDMQSEQDLQQEPIQETTQEATPTELPDLNFETKNKTPQSIQGEDPPSKKLWQGFVDNGAYTGTFEDFQKATSNKDQIDKLYLGLINNEDFHGSKDDFYKNFFPDVSQEFEQPKEDVITATLKANNLKNKKKITQTTVYDPMMGDVVTETEETDVDANKEGLKLESDLEKRGYKKEQRDQILKEWGDVSVDDLDKIYNRKELANLRDKDYLKYKYILDNAKTQLDIKKKLGTDAANEYVQAANTLKKVGGTIEDLNRLQNNNQYKIDIINKTLTGEERDRALNRLNEYTSMIVSKDVSPKQAEDYLNSKFYGTEKQFAPTEVTPFTPEQAQFGGDVNQLSLESIEQNLDPNNLVEQIVFQKYKYGRNLNSAVANTGTFDDAAIEFAKSQDPQIAGYTETIQLPNETKGRLVKQWLDNPDVQQMVAQNPELLRKYNDTKTKFEFNYPDYVANGAAQKISNKRQELGWNNFLVNIPSQANTDELAQQMHENGELSDQEYFQYQNQISPEIGVMQSLKRNILNTNPLFALAGYGGNESPIKTPGIAENFATAMSSGFENIGKFGKDVAQYMTPAGYVAPEVFKKLDAKRLYKNVLTNEKAAPLVNAGALHEWSERTGNILGSIVPLMLGGEISAAAKLGGWSGELISGALNFEGANRDQAMVLFPGEENTGKRNAYTAISTLGDAFLMRLLPTKKIAAVFKKDAVNIIEDLASKKITGEAAKNKILSLGYNLAKDNATTSGVMTGYGLFHKGVESIFNGDDINAGKLALETLKEYKSTFLSTIPLAALTTFGNAKYHGKILKEMAENPEAYSQFIVNKIKTNPEFQKEGNEQLENLRISADILSDINQTDLTDAQKEKYLLNGLAQKIYERRATETKDENVAKLNLAKAKEFADKNKKIFDGKDQAKEFETFGNEEETNEIKQELDKEKGVTKEVVTEEGEKLPIVEEAITEKQLPEEKDITIGDVINKKGNYKGEEGTFYQDGQTVVFAVDGTNREYEVGSIKEIKDTPIKDFGIEHKESVVSIGDEGQVLVRGKEYENNYSDPMMAINRDKEGNVVSVTLDTPSGQKRTFKGNVAEDLAYQIHLKEINKNNETRADFEQHINEDATAQKEIDNARVPETPKAGAVKNIQPVQREKIQPVVKKATPTPKAKAPTPTPAKAPEKAPAPLTKQQQLAQKFLQEIEGVEPKTKEVAPPKVHTVETIDKIDTEGYSDEQKKALGGAKQIVKAVAKLVQESTKKKLEVVIHDSKETYTDEVIKAGGTRQDSESKGFYLGKDGKIHLNMELVTSETLKHEAFHPVLDFMADNNPKIIDDLHNQLKNLPGGSKIVATAERAYKGASESTIKKEAITDYIARVADGSISLERNTWQQVKDFVLTALNKLGINLSKDINSISDLQQLAREISRKFQTGEEVKFEKGETANSNQKVQLQADFTHKESGIEWRYFKNTEEFQKLVDEGYVTFDKNIDDFNGAVVLHAPDAAFSGQILKEGKVIAKGKGGVYYPLVFHENGDFWAATELGASKLAETLNEAKAKSPDGKVRMILISSPVDKLMSSSLNGIGLIDILTSKAFSDKSGITPEQLRKSIINAIRSTEAERLQGKEGMKPNRSELPKITGKESLSELAQKLKEFYPPESSNFPTRKRLNRNILNGIASYSTSKKVASQLLNFLGEGSFNEKLTTTGGRLSAKNLTQGFSNILAEPTLRGEGTGKMYAVIELAADVKPVRTSEHESYPFSLRSVDPKEKPYVHILTGRDYWYNHIKDKNGKIIGENKDLQNSILPPSAGVSNVVELQPTAKPSVSELTKKAKPIPTEQFKLNLSSATLRESSPEIKGLYENAKKAFNEGNFDEANKIYTKILDIGERTLNKAFGKIDGAEIKLERSKGNYFGGEEPTFIGELKITDPSKRQEAFSAIADFGDIHSQEAIHVSKVLDKLPEGAKLGKENEDGSVYEPNVDIRFDKPLTDAEYKDLSAFLQTIGEKDQEIAGSTLHTDKKGINLYNISKFKDHETFTDQIAELIQKLRDNGRVLSSVEEKVRQLWNYGESEGAGGSTRTYEQLRGGDLPSQVFPKKGELQFSKIKLPNGEEVKAKDTQEPEVINGFYSPIEKKILDTKQNNLSATKWLNELGRTKDETVYTGLKDFLESKRPDQQVTKKELLDYMKNNRIDIREVILKEGKGQTAKERFNKDIELSGEKENYKEVLITLPFKKAAELPEGYTTELGRDGMWRVYDEEQGLIGQGKTEQLAKEDALSEPETAEKPVFKSSHYEEPNIAVHLRMNTRIDAEGNKVLFLEEVQSDWGQKGKREGFKKEVKPSDIEILSDKPTYYDNEKRSMRNEVTIKVKGFKDIDSGAYFPNNETIEQYKERVAKSYSEILGTSTAPFVTDTNAWTKLGLKYAIQHAIKEGADKVAWTTGEQQNERYDLSKQVDSITWVKNKETGKYDILAWKDGKTSFAQKGMSENELEGAVGKDIADRIINKKEGQYVDSQFAEQGDLKGEQLKVGGKGMIGFYGSPEQGKEGIVGSVAKSLVRELTGKEGNIGKTNINGDYQNSIDITPEIKASVEKGLPQFSKAENKAASMMRELVQSHIDEGKNLEQIREEIKKDFGSFYDKHEALFEQTYQDLTTTGIKNVVTKAERAERGLDEIEVEMKRGFGDVIENAKKDIEEAKISPELLAAEIAKKPRPLSAEESAALIMDRVKISNQYDAKYNELQRAYDKGDTNQAKIIESQLYVLEERMQINDEAARKSGYEQGLGLAARRMLMARDYSLATQLARAKAANGGKELPKDIRKKFEDLTEKLKQANAKLDEYEAKEAKKELDKEVKATKKSTKTPEEISAQKVKTKDTILGKLKKFFGAKAPEAKKEEGGAMYSKAPLMTPEQEAKAKYLTEISNDVKGLVKLYAEGGNRNLDNIISDIHKDISAQFPEITKQDIEDVVVGKYKKEKVATPLDATKLAIQANVKRVQNEIDLLRDNLALKQRGKGELLMDYLHGWHRFALLSSIPSIPKIAGAALGRGVTSRLEGVIGQGLSYVPGLRGIAKGAIREGRLSPKAEAKAFAQWFDKMTFEDLRNIYKTGMSDLDIQYGDKKEFAAKVPQWMEFFGRMHSMIKYLPKRAEFFRSMEMRAEQAIKEGKNPKDPIVQYELGLEAYNDAIRAVFMQDNAIADAYKAAINKWEKSDVQGMPTVANFFKLMFPIIKVPTNYVAEQSSYAIGGFKAGTTLVKAALSLENGIKDLTPQQKDNVMRALKKQTIGIAIALLGYYNPQAIGGYYTGKRKEGDLEAGDIVVFGVKLPHWASHTPLLEMLQVGATIRRAMDDKSEKSKYKKEWTKFGEGAFDAAIESVKKIPFFGTGERIAEAWGDENKLSNFVSGLAQSIIEPQALKNAAEFFDKEEGGEKIKREPKTFIETLKTGVPGLREQVPIKKTYSFLKEKDYEDEDFKVLKDNGITVGIGKRTAINVGFSKEHPDGHMTEEEYDKYYEEANNYIKNGGTITDEEGNQKSIPSLKEFLNSSADMTLSDIYGEEISTETSLVKNLPTSPMTVEQNGKKVEAKGLSNPLQDAIDAYKSDVFKAVKEKMKLVPKTYKSKLNLEYKEFNKD